MPTQEKDITASCPNEADILEVVGQSIRRLEISAKVQLFSVESELLQLRDFAIHAHLPVTTHVVESVRDHNRALPISQRRKPMTLITDEKGRQVELHGFISVRQLVAGA
jgi:hypothetical protein